MSENNNEVNEQVEETAQVSSETAEQVTPEVVPPAPEDINAYVFQTHYPVFCKVVDRLTSAELKRLAKYLIGFPLEVSENDLDFQTDDALYAFNLGEKIKQAAFGLTLKALTENMDKLNDLADEQSQEENKTEVSNG